MPIPVVDDAARAALRDVFDVPGVVQASLVGSVARGTAHALSDVDLAVWLDPALEGMERLRLAGELRDAAVRVLGSERVDLIDLHRASPLVRHRVIRDRVVLVERDFEERVRLDTRALIEFWDTEHLRQVLGEGLRRRIREGTYGRP